MSPAASNPNAKNPSEQKTPADLLGAMSRFNTRAVRRGLVGDPLEKHKAAAKEKLRVVMNKYRVEAVLLDDVLQAESELSEATADEASALLGIWAAWAGLEKALGQG